MSKLEINLKRIPVIQGNLLFEYLIIGFLILVALSLLPFLIIFWLFGLLYNLLSQNKPVRIDSNWIAINTGTELKITYNYVNVDDMEDYIYHSFDTSPLLIFNSEPPNLFFEGYFTNLKIERADGIFPQKVIHNENNKEIDSLPLFFFNYATQNAERILDLKGYEYDVKGNAGDFIIDATGKEENLQIRFSTLE